MSDAEEYCSCGFPQSKPIPHTHDLTDREKAIVKKLKAEQDNIRKLFIESMDSQDPSHNTNSWEKELKKARLETAKEIFEAIEGNSSYISKYRKLRTFEFRYEDYYGVKNGFLSLENKEAKKNE